MEITFFAAPAGFRKWLERNHGRVQELWVGYYKKSSGRPSITWPESVDEALCFGWIDGLRRSVDDVSYTIRFTPRKAGSTWSAVNIRRVAELTEQGRMQPAGLAAFERRKAEKSEIYSYEREHATLGEEYEAIFQENEKAWANFQSMAPSYRKAATWWVVSAKQEATRRKRLATLVENSEEGRKIPAMRRKGE